MSGIRFQPSARIEPPWPAPIRSAYSREVGVRSTPSTIGSRRAATPSSSNANVPSPRHGVVEVGGDVHLLGAVAQRAEVCGFQGLVPACAPRCR